MSSRSATKNTTTYAIALKARHKLPRAVELAAAMQCRDLGQHLLEVYLRLLRLLAEELDRPLLALAEERKQRIEQLVARHTRHALVLAFLRLDLRTLQQEEIRRKKEFIGPPRKKGRGGVALTVRSAKPAADEIPLLSIFPPPRPARAPSISPTRTAFSFFAAAPRAVRRRS